jgi:hypothetical protein
VHTHRIEVFDGADDDNVVFEVAHDLELELFPPYDRLFNQCGVNRTQIQPALHHAFKFLAVKGDAAANPTQCE